MTTTDTAETDSLVASDNYNETVSWADWRNLLTQKDEDEIALAVGLLMPDGSCNVTERDDAGIQRPLRFSSFDEIISQLL